MPAIGVAQMEFSLEEVEETSASEAPPKSEAFEESGDDVIEALAKGESASDSDLDARSTQAVDDEEVYAVQQIYALRLRRFELAPSAALTLNDPYLAHPAAGIALNYWWTNVLAVGVSFLWYDWSFATDPTASENLNLFIQRSFRLGVPITQWQLGTYLNFTYVPFYGKFSTFNKFIFQWDAYVVGGVGMMRTRPISKFDPEVREFDYGFRAAFNAGIGIRIFFTRWLALFTEFRNYMYLERFENTEVDVLRRTDKSTWFADSPTFTNNATVQIGFTFFFPSKFKYRLPK